MSESVDLEGAASLVDDDEERGSHTIKVHVLHVNETERASFRMAKTSTLREVWAQAYIELKVDRREKDIFQTGGHSPVSLMGHLDLTLKQAHEQKLVDDYKFSIVCETGGA